MHEKKGTSTQAEPHRPDLRRNYRDLAIPAVIAACMAQSAKGGAVAGRPSDPPAPRRKRD